MIKKIAFIILCILTLIACNTERPDNVLERDKMIYLLYEINLADAMVRNNNIPYTDAARYYQKLFKKHKVTPAIFDSSLVWYTKDIKVHAALYNDIQKLCEKELDYINQGYYEQYESSNIFITDDYFFYNKKAQIDSTKLIILNKPTAELGTNDSCSYPYIQRLRSN